MSSDLLLIAAVAAGFIAGGVWRAIAHRCQPVGVHDLDAAYRRGFADGVDAGRRAAADVTILQRMWERS